MEHYYSSEPTTPHDIHTIEYILRDHRLKFTTDSGVFSKGRVDFGTDLLINTIPELEGNVLDLGCGYGPIGISLALLNPNASIHMVDINQRAVTLAQQNIDNNNITNAKSYISDGFSHVSSSFNAIVTNPPIRAGKKVIYPLFEEAIDFLDIGGSLYIVIQKKQGAPSAIKKLEQIFGNCHTLARKKGYLVLRSIKC